MISRFFEGKGDNIQRESFIWNTIAGLVNAAEAIVFMMVITRTNGLAAAGILSIAFAVGNLLMTLGKFGVRNFQATDIRRQFPFHTYLTLRIGTSLLMAVFSVGYVFLNMAFSDYTPEKSAVIVGICFIYVIESFEDVYLGYYQLEGRLDVASKIFVCRWLAIMAAFTACAVIWHNLVYAVWFSVVLSFLLEIILLLITGRIVRIPSIKCQTDGIGRMVKQCFPLFLAAFLTYYITNAPKYAIDRALSEDMQAYYGYISMPVFVVELLNCFLYQPQIVGLAEAWNDGDIKLLRKKRVRQLLIILGLTLACVMGAYLLGIPVLSMIYGADLSGFKTELVILMVAGGALACVGYTSVLLTVMRKQQLLLYNMVIAAVLAAAGFGCAVNHGGVLGASVYYLILVTVLAALNYCSIVVSEIHISKGDLKL